MGLLFTNKAAGLLGGFVAAQFRNACLNGSGKPFAMFERLDGLCTVRFGIQYRNWDWPRNIASTDYPQNPQIPVPSNLLISNFPCHYLNVSSFPPDPRCVKNEFSYSQARPPYNLQSTPPPQALPRNTDGPRSQLGCGFSQSMRNERSEKVRRCTCPESAGIFMTWTERQEDSAFLVARERALETSRRIQGDEVKAGSEFKWIAVGSPFIDRAITCCFMVQALPRNTDGPRSQLGCGFSQSMRNERSEKVRRCTCPESAGIFMTWTERQEDSAFLVARERALETSRRIQGDEVKAGSEFKWIAVGSPFIDRAITCCFMVQVFRRRSASLLCWEKIFRIVHHFPTNFLSNSRDQRIPHHLAGNQNPFGNSHEVAEEQATVKPLHVEGG
ncbi:hypothetical protein WH47_02194 [Habropoda laboriosa]|uniref:Uncharacterized protein n=1 Tax=Habropoda laboriosa TaxID=597456 RepID=A0A0L7QZ56_9HYME|nr:hypothetical protein WH47_02194 [Habropoda laboriosa]